MEINTNFCIFLILNPTNKSLFLDFKSPLLLAYELFFKKQLHGCVHNEFVSHYSITNYCVY